MFSTIKNLIKNRIYIPIQHVVRSPNKDSIWIFGLQKAGTTAIAALLAHMSGLTISIDTRYLWSPYGEKIRKGKLPISKHVNNYSYPFSKDIIKEPSTTLYIEKIESYFDLHKYVFIIRNPYSNIRSILNRLNIPGDKKDINILRVHPNWRNKFPNNGENYISDLANLWLKANNQDEYMFNERCTLVKYEDFKMRKEKFIKDLCLQLELGVNNSIREIMDKEFQPKGNSEIDLKSFFGEKNINIIKNICNKRMDKLGYSVEAILE